MKCGQSEQHDSNVSPPFHLDTGSLIASVLEMRAVCWDEVPARRATLHAAQAAIA